MERIRELKKELGENYLFRRFLSDKEIRKLQKSNPTFFESQIVASLTAGCVKMECCVCKASNNLQLGYDVFVKDDPVSSDWIFYDRIDSPNVSVGTKETDMLALLDQVVEWNGLSYTECCFEKLDGKNVLKKYGKKEEKMNHMEAEAPTMQMYPLVKPCVAIFSEKAGM